ncbi:DUF916 domain-containing protein [Glutamicibacter sp. MNS18]|uniref:DUF916 domain-containing protein n=1 Tax=Glutamicibacter sp. MNS18 TaxID=2989817 RepID=UPI0022367F9A|nr:DUF916 domain-containing protein [Glutamicibacter sp. MNS18]MCW4464969.1 DUF916 domain-containing protein [Glutamicibacter sp. MNS18]
MPHKPQNLISRVAAAALLTASLASAPALAAAAPADREPSITWSMNPAADSGHGHWIEMELSPGETRTEQLVLKNHSEQPATFGLQAADGYFTDSGRFNMLSSDQPSHAAGTWISIQDEVSVDAKSAETVPFTVTVPSNATPGDHAAGVASVVSSLGQSGDGASIGLESRIGFRVMTRVEGPLQPSLAVGSIEAAYNQSWNPFAPGHITADLSVGNDGNLQLDPATSLAAPLAAGSDTLETGSLLPGDSAQVSAALPNVWPLFLVPATIEVTGTDTAGSRQVLLTERIWVWALPLPQLLVAAGVFLCLTGLRRRKSRQDARLAQLLDQARQDGAAQVRLQSQGAGR